MRFRNGMTSVVGTALAVVAAGSLVLFSVVLQNSAFDAGAPRPLEARTPGSSDGSVQVPGFEEDSEGSQTAAEPGTGEGSPLPTDAGDLLSPSGDLDGGEPPLVASVEPPAGEDDPTFEGGTGITPGFIGGPGGPSFINGGPQATINNDQNAPGQPGDEPLPPKDGPKNVQPPHGPQSPGDSWDDDRGSKADSPGDDDDHAKPGKSPDVKDDNPVNNPDKDKDSKDKDSKDKDSKDKDSKDKDSKPSKDSKPKASQPKSPEPKDDDDDERENDDDDRRDDDSRDGRDSDHRDVSVSNDSRDD